MQYILKKEVLGSFIDSVSRKSDVIGPVSGGKDKKNSQSKFSRISSADELYLDKKTYYPVKNFFFDKKEVLFKFNGDKIINQ